MGKRTGGHESSKNTPECLKLINTRELRSEGEMGSCLRPLGLCELGGCCDVCWYGGGRQSPTEHDSSPTGPK